MLLEHLLVHGRSCNLTYANNFSFASAVTQHAIQLQGGDRAPSSWWCRSLISHAVSVSSAVNFL